MPRDPRHRRRQQGFALIAALALLVVLGSTGAVMLRMSSFQQAGSSRAILAARGAQAAKSGIEWGRHAARAADACPAPVSTLTLAEGALSGFQVVVTCRESRHREATDEKVTVALEARATFGALGSRDYVYREARETASF